MSNDALLSSYYRLAEKKQMACDDDYKVQLQGDKGMS